MISVKPNDYVVAQVDERKNIFGKVLKVKESKVILEDQDTIVLEKDTLVKVKPKDIIANLGTKPKFGKSFGRTTEAFHGSSDHKKWGRINYFRELELVERKALHLALKKVWLRLKHYGLHKGILPIEMDIRNNHGKIVGYYAHRAKGRGDVLTLCLPKIELKDAKFVLFHEYGHGWWFNKMTSNTKVKWIECYHYFMNLSKIPTEKLIITRKTLEKMGSIKTFKQEFGEKDTDAITPAVILNECLKYVSRVHGLNSKNVEILLSAEKSLKPYWPTSPLELSEAKLILTEYAKKNTEEFFSEALALFLTQKKLPKTVNKLMKETIAV